jgi:hypothetical protein
VLHLFACLKQFAGSGTNTKLIGIIYFHGNSLLLIEDNCSMVVLSLPLKRLDIKT